MSGSIFDQGAVLVPEFVTPAEERRILQRIAEAPWMTDIGRRVQHYGYRYDYRGSAPPRPAPAPPPRVRAPAPRPAAAPFPRWVATMAERLAPWFDGAVAEQCIVNEYVPGQGIGMHADHAQFGPVVASLSLAADWPMRFRPRRVRPYARDGLPGDEVAALPRRSALVLAGPARTDFMHGIDRGAGRGRAVRVSATFRTLAR